MIYKYEISGLAADDQTWIAHGTVEVAALGQFMEVPNMAVGEAFKQLTQGRAIYGKPGIGCHGPYRIVKMTIEELR